MKRKFLIICFVLICVCLYACSNHNTQNSKLNITQNVVGTENMNKNDSVNDISDFITDFITLAFNIDENYNPDGIEKFYPSLSKESWINDAKSNEISSSINKITISDICFDSDSKIYITTIVESDFQNVINDRAEYYLVYNIVVEDSENGYAISYCDLYAIANIDQFTIERTSDGDLFFSKEGDL